MGDFNALKFHIYGVGETMVRCDVHCDGIHLDPLKGVLPRALNLELDGRYGEIGVVALGINPGTGDAHEVEHYLQNGNSYAAMDTFWAEHRRDRHPYHVRTRRFIDACGLSGPILWTELVKCQNAPGKKGLPPLETIRACVHFYLIKEMAEVPSEWPIIAIGKKPYEIAAMVFPSRTVIGIPHPTGSYGHFPKLFDTEERLKSEFERAVSSALVADIPTATWLKVSA